MAAIIHDPEFWLTIAVLVFIGIVWRPAKRLLTGGLDARDRTVLIEAGFPVDGQNMAH